MELKLSDILELMKSMEQKMDSLSERMEKLDKKIEKYQRRTDENFRFMGEYINERMEKYQRITDSRFDNFRTAQNSFEYPAPPRRKAYVPRAKPDHANYVSDGEIRPLPRYYR